MLLAPWPVFLFVYVHVMVSNYSSMTNINSMMLRWTDFKSITDQVRQLFKVQVYGQYYMYVTTYVRTRWFKQNYI